MIAPSDRKFGNCSACGKLSPLFDTDGCDAKGKEKTLRVKEICPPCMQGHLTGKKTIETISLKKKEKEDLSWMDEDRCDVYLDKVALQKRFDSIDLSPMAAVESKEYEITAL